MGLIQREVESRGIRTASIVHLPKVAARVRPPRMLQIDFPLGLTFSTANNVTLQALIVKDLLEFALQGGDEEIRKKSYSL